MPNPHRSGILLHPHRHLGTPLGGGEALLPLERPQQREVLRASMSAMLTVESTVGDAVRCDVSVPWGRDGYVVGGTSEAVAGCQDGEGLLEFGMGNRRREVVVAR